MTDRNSYIAGLRKLADVLETRPEVPLPYEGSSTAMTFHFLSGENPKAEMAACARALPTSFAKEADGKYFDLLGSLAGLKVRLCAFRDEVCARVVTGTHEVEVTEPDPEALAKVPQVTKTVTVEDVEWICAPVLAPATTESTVTHS
jgi:hypothetical protein